MTPNTGMPLVELEDVSFRYGDGPVVLNNVSLQIQEGEFVALLGANGAGKTTFAKLLNGLLRPTSGSIHISGRDISELRTAQLAATVGYCYQNPDHQIFNETVRQELAFGPKNLGVEAEEIDRRVEEVLQFAALTEHGDTYPFLLSKGLRQKIAVASILTIRPELMIIDEPTTGMDYRGSHSIMELIKELNEAGHTLLIITHDINLVAEYAQRVIVFKEGNILLDEHPRELFSQADLLERVLSVATPVYQLTRKLRDVMDPPHIATVDHFLDWYGTLLEGES